LLVTGKLTFKDLFQKAQQARMNNSDRLVLYVSDLFSVANKDNVPDDCNKIVLTLVMLNGDNETYWSWKPDVLGNIYHAASTFLNLENKDDFECYLTLFKRSSSGSIDDIEVSSKMRDIPNAERLFGMLGLNSQKVMGRFMHIFLQSQKI